MIKTVRTPKLEIAYQETGPADGPPVILLHGWPSDPHDWDGVVPPLAADGCRVLVPGCVVSALPASWTRAHRDPVSRQRSGQMCAT